MHEVCLFLQSYGLRFIQAASFAVPASFFALLQQVSRLQQSFLLTAHVPSRFLAQDVSACTGFCAQVWGTVFGTAGRIAVSAQLPISVCPAQWAAQCADWLGIVFQPQKKCTAFPLEVLPTDVRCARSACTEK